MDRYFWRAIYSDGTGVSQNDIDPVTGGELSSNSVDLSRLVAMTLEPKLPGVNRVILHVQPGEKPQRFWRHWVSAMGGDSCRRTCWCLTLEKNGVTFGAFFRPDGSIVLSTDINGGSDIKI